ncbi:MAG: hypothetical protein K0Q55_2501 [Verrucomicrobia bacterium]|jgi:hypothetical protein|nr:hypothetical protein [Verrucomicrobiota bacterium]
MSNRLLISRRTLLRGLGASLALPWLEAMGPMTSWAADTKAGSAAPNRMAFLYVPNGVNMKQWKPQKDGTLGELPPTLALLNDHKRDFSVLTGLTADKARANGDGGGDHARALSAYLTGCQPRKTDGTDIRAGVSVDQVAAGRLAAKTRFGSLEIGTEAGSMAGNCDSGYSCVYSSTMSWRSATQPLPKEVNPKLVFERMFGTGSKAEREKRDAQRKSVLDLVKEDFSELNGKLGKSDQRKLDEYFSAVRDLELRIERAAHMPEAKAPENFGMPAGIPASYEEHIKIMADLMIAAFQTDSTRVCTFVLANEGSNKNYPFIGINDGHHNLSHHQNREDNLSKLAQINQFHIRQFAYILDRMKSIKEGDGTLLDHTMLCYGSGNSDGDRHNHDDLPLLLAGRGCGTITPGRHIIYPNETPLNNLWLSLLNRMEIQTHQLGDSTGELKGLVTT